MYIELTDGAVLNTEDHTLLCNDRKSDIPRNEYLILLTLIQNRNKVVSREEITNAFLEEGIFIDDKALPIIVGRLRKTLEEAGIKGLTITGCGVAYILKTA